MNSKFLLGTATLAAVIAFASPASAAILYVPASSGQGTLVHGTGTEQTALDVIGNLGANGPNIVHFTGDTSQTVATSDLLRLQGGEGQADVTGAEITLGGTPNDVYAMYSGNIFLTGHAGIDYLEFALTSGVTGTINFLLDDGAGGTQAFNNIAIGSGDTHYAFNTTGLSSITNLYWSANSPPGSVTLLKQVRLDQSIAAVPEPATWAMMLIGFGAIGAFMRRRPTESVKGRVSFS